VNSGEFFEIAISKPNPKLSASEIRAQAELFAEETRGKILSSRRAKL
jgi:hypothetical protein